MSAEIVNTKVKKITLAGKYSKFLVFGHWFIQRLNADEAVVAAARDTLQMFLSPEEQNQMFDLFFNELKTSTAEMKALIKQHNKPPPKAKKEKKVKDPSEKKPKAKGKKATEVVTDPQDALVAEIVAAAQTEIAPGAEQRVVLRKGEPTVPPNPLPTTAEEAVVALAQPAKKKVMKKAAKAVVEEPAQEVAVAVVAEEPVKKNDKAAEKEAKEAAKAAEKKAKEDAKKGGDKKGGVAKKEAAGAGAGAGAAAEGQQ
jgi:hypothetical protein